MLFKVTSKYSFTVKGGDYEIMFTAQAGTIFEKYVHSNKEKGRVRRCLIGTISQKDSNVWSFAGTS